MILIWEHLVPVSSLLTIAFNGNQKSISHEHRQCPAFNPLHGGVMFAGASDYTDFLVLSLTLGKKSGFREPAGNTTHSYMCHNRCAQLQIKQRFLALSETRTSA